MGSYNYDQTGQNQGMFAMGKGYKGNDFSMGKGFKGGGKGYQQQKGWQEKGYKGGGKGQYGNPGKGKGDDFSKGKGGGKATLDHQKDRRGKPYSMDHATTAGHRNIQQEDVHTWEKASKGTATRVGRLDTLGTSAQSFHMEKEREKGE